MTVRAPEPDEVTFVLGSTPAQCVSIELPHWLNTYLGWEPTWTHIDAWVAFEPVWQILRRESGFEAILLFEHEPNTDAQGRATDWWQLISHGVLAAGQSDAAVELWTRYRALTGADS
jgi:hypothetical protein